MDGTSGLVEGCGLVSLTSYSASAPMREVLASRRGSHLQAARIVYH